MAFRLCLTGSFDPSAVAHSLHLRAPRVATPQVWHWAWPLHLPLTPTSTTPSTNPTPTVPRHVWIHAIRSVAVSDDGFFLAFLSHSGVVSLARTRAHSPPTPVCPPSDIQIDLSDDWSAIPTSIALFQLTRNGPAKPRTILSVGYQSGAIAFFDAASVRLLLVSRPVPDAPVRRLRYYPFFVAGVNDARAYPSPTPNSGLVAVLGWAGVVARLPTDELISLLPDGRNTTHELSNLLVTATPTIDPLGAGWSVWHLSTQDAVLDAVLCGPNPSAICDFDADPHSTAPLRLATAGIAPPIAAHVVSPRPAFSARAAAKRAASTVLSAARGFLMARIASATDYATSSTPVDEERAAVQAVARHVASWADDPAPLHASLNFADVRGTARKSVSAVLQRARNPTDVAPQRQPPTTSVSEDRAVLTALREAALGTASDTKTQNALSSMDDQTSSVAAALPTNTRYVERIAVAPQPCSLIATCDSLGRIFVQDSRDLCVLRILKGYRDAHVAWLAHNEPLLAVVAPRLDVLELHGPLEQRRREAFRLLPGSILVQTTAYSVFVVFPDGRLFELASSKKCATETGVSSKRDNISGRQKVRVGNRKEDVLQGDTANSDPSLDNSSFSTQEGTPPDYELTGQFVEAVKNGRTSQAVECLQEVECDSFKVAHLMATLVTCSSYIRTEVHVALSSKAGQIATRLQNPDLVCRFEAHRRLAEAFGLLVVDDIPDHAGTEQRPYGPKLKEDDIGSGLADYDAADPLYDSQFSNNGRDEDGSPGLELVNCERFILSHSLEPTFDATSDTEYEIRPRVDLSQEERRWLSMAYFGKLLDSGGVDIPTAGREHPTCGDVFLALSRFIRLTEAEVTRQFVTFILHTPLHALLNTYVSTYASPMQCTIARIRSKFRPAVVDPIVIDACETTTRIANAVLLMRLCILNEVSKLSDDDSNPFLQLLDRLDEVFLYRKMIAGSRVPHEVYESFTARQCTGIPGDAERQAVKNLIEADDYERAVKILSGQTISRKLDNMDWHESASISEAALHACRKKAVNLILDMDTSNVPENVISWIKAADLVADKPSQLSEAQRKQRMTDVRAVLMSAHPYIPDSSVDAVRSLQLAEAMSVLIEGGATTKVVETVGRVEDCNNALDHRDAPPVNRNQLPVGAETPLAGRYMNNEEKDAGSKSVSEMGDGMSTTMVKEVKTAQVAVVEDEGKKQPIAEVEVEVAEQEVVSVNLADSQFEMGDGEDVSWMADDSAWGLSDNKEDDKTYEDEGNESDDQFFDAQAPPAKTENKEGE